jgi:MFS family permease
MTFVLAFVVEGVVVVSIGVLFLSGHHVSLAEATTFAAFCLAYRRVSLVLLSAMAGWIADHLGLERLFTLSIFGVMLGLALLISGWAAIGTVVVFTFSSITSTFAPGLGDNGRLDYRHLTENATWRDIGAAAGTLMGGFLIYHNFLQMVFVITIFILTILLLVPLGKRQVSKFNLWK